MKTGLFTLLACSLFAIPGYAQGAPRHFDVVQQVYAEQPPAHTLDSAVSFLVRLVQRLNALYPSERVGLLIKTAGESIAPYGGTMVSASRLCYPSPPNQPGYLPLAKVLSDVPTTNGAEWLDDSAVQGNPNWIGGCLLIGDTMPPPVITPPPVVTPPIPSVDLSGLYARLDQVEAALDAKIQSAQEQLTNEHAAQNATLAAIEADTHSTRDTLVSVTKFVAKYALPAIAAFFGGKKMAQ